MPKGEHAPGGQPGANTGPAALELRVSGASFHDIAVMLGLAGPRQAIDVIERELAEHLTEDDIDAQRVLATQQLDALLNKVWDKATDADCSEHLVAVNTARLLIDRKIKLLGLDRPTQIELFSPAQAEIERWVATVAAVSGPDVEEADIIGGADGPAELGPGS
jgi:hypothetical protein